MSVEPSGCRPAPATSGKPVFLVPLPVGPPLPNDRPTDSAPRTGARDGVSERRPSSDSTGWPAWRNWQRTCLVNRGFPVRVRASALYRRRSGGGSPCTDGAASAEICLQICLRSAPQAPRALFRPPPRRTTVLGRTQWTLWVAMNSLLLFRDQMRLWRPRGYGLVGIDGVKTSRTASYSIEALLVSEVVVAIAVTPGGAAAIRTRCDWERAPGGIRCATGMEQRAGGLVFDVTRGVGHRGIPVGASRRSSRDPVSMPWGSAPQKVQVARPLWSSTLRLRPLRPLLDGPSRSGAPQGLTDTTSDGAHPRTNCRLPAAGGLAPFSA